ncbi:MAG: tannase/feruloyl esterase family alpha/beta hydrolase, partial [Steroidobacteraceae bacterium]
YFAGCSGGGRQAMLASQRFPEQFDGLVAGAPASRIADIGIGGLKRYQALVGKTPQELANLLSKEDLQLISDGIAKQCDALDGTSDGLIFNFKQCNFKPESLACKSGQTSGCLSADKLKWFDALVSAPKTSTGKEAYSAFPYDTAVSAPGWLMGLTIGLPGNTSQEAMRSVQLLYFTPHEARDFREITIDDALASTEEMRKLTNTRSTDLDAFRKHGSKILYYHGISDQIISANDTFQYYDALLEKYGPATQSFARFYPVPGFLHCFGGSGLTDFDMLGALVDWVEKGKAPDTIIAGNSQRPGETRPLCPYPSYARYSGKGDPKTAASYSCAK